MVLDNGDTEHDQLNKLILEPHFPHNLFQVGPTDPIVGLNSWMEVRWLNFGINTRFVWFSVGGVGIAAREAK